MATYGRGFNTSPEITPYSDQGAALRFVRVGDWDKAERLLKFLASPGNTGAKSAILRAQQSFAQKLKKTLIKGVITEGASIGEDWLPHGERYQAWTRHKGFGDTGLLRLSNNYLRALRNMRVLQKGYTTSLRLSQSDSHKRSHKKGLVMSQYAVIMEVGDLAGKIPARPLWGPSYRSLGGDRALVGTVKQILEEKLSNI